MENVTDVLPVIVKVDVKAPEVVNEPPNVKVDVPLLTPVPPLAGRQYTCHTCLVSGNPVQLVKMPDAGVPNKGAVNIGASKVGELVISIS